MNNKDLWSISITLHLLFFPLNLYLFWSSAPWLLPLDDTYRPLLPSPSHTRVFSNLQTQKLILRVNFLHSICLIISKHYQFQNILFKLNKKYPANITIIDKIQNIKIIPTKCKKNMKVSEKAVVFHAILEVLDNDRQEKVIYFRN